MMNFQEFVERRLTEMGLPTPMDNTARQFQGVLNQIQGLINAVGNPQTKQQLFQLFVPFNKQVSELLAQNAQTSPAAVTQPKMSQPQMSQSQTPSTTNAG